MVFNKVINFFRRKTSCNSLARMHEPNDKLTEIEPYLQEAALMLDIVIPEIKLVNCLFDYNGSIQALVEFNENDIPEDAHFLGAFYPDKQNVIYISMKVPNCDLDKKTKVFTDCTVAEMLFVALHELRHIWQKKYHFDAYYQHNAVGLEIINDPAEIDADAFAIAYVFSSKTDFTAKDFPVMMEEICLQAALDKGERWERAKSLSSEYGLGCNDKVSAAKNSIDERIIKKYLDLARLD